MDVCYEAEIAIFVATDPTLCYALNLTGDLNDLN